MCAQIRTEYQTSCAIDYIKCIGIVLVVIGHHPKGDIFNIMRVYMFHMPLFFFLGGMLFHTRKNLSEYYIGIFKKYFLYIFLSYLILGVSADLLHFYFSVQKRNIFANSILETVYIAIKSNFHNNYFFMVGWFLFAYMLVLTIAFPMIKLFNRIQNTEYRIQNTEYRIQNTEYRIQNTEYRIYFISFCLCVFALLIGYIGISILSPIYKESKFIGLNILIQVMVGSMFFYLGFALKSYIWKILNPVVACFLFLLLIYLKTDNLIGSLVMSWSKYEFGFFYSLLGSIIGIYITFVLADMLARYGDFKLFRIVGQNSKSVMTFHLIAFTLINIIFAKLGLSELDPNKITAYPSQPYAFPMFVCFSIFISIWIGKFLEKISKGYYC